MRHNIIYFIFFFFILNSCKQGQEEKTNFKEKEMASVNETIADTIIYDVIVKNPSPDDWWTEECLRNLDKRKLVDMIFDNIYSGKLKAYDHTTNELLKPNEIKKIENSENFNRDNIGKLQFMESWNMNTEGTSILKKVDAVTLGYEYYDNDGNLFGYRPLFKVIFN